MAKRHTKGGMTIKLAPQDKQQRVEPIQDLFLEKVLGVEGALITDMSRISDFFQYPKDRAIRGGKAPGTYVFLQKRYVGPHVNPLADGKLWRQERNKTENWETIEIEVEPDPPRDEVTKK